MRYQMLDPREDTIEAQLLGILVSTETTFAGKQFICRLLRRIGTERSVPVLLDLLRCWETLAFVVLTWSRISPTESSLS